MTLYDIDRAPLCRRGRSRAAFRPCGGCLRQPADLVGRDQKLEDELGTQIFERRTNDVTMTPAGERIVGQAQRTLDEAGRIRR